jgi:hypothetical protein
MPVSVMTTTGQQIRGPHIRIRLPPGLYLRRTVVGAPREVSAVLQRHRLEGCGLWCPLAQTRPPSPRPDLRWTAVGELTEAATMMRHDGGGSTSLRWLAKGKATPLCSASCPPVSGMVPWWHCSVPGVAPWWCGGRQPCCARCGAPMVPASSATMAIGEFRLLLSRATTAGAQRLCGCDGRLVGQACRREVGMTTVRRSYSGGQWSAAPGTSPRRKWLQE